LDGISIHDTRAVADYFERAVKRPWLPFKAVPAQVEVEIAKVPVKIAFSKEAWRSLTAGKRYSRAAWMWLRPAEPRLTTKDLAGLRAAVGLDHVHLQTFALRVIEACREITRDHAQLMPWGEYRVAALEFEAHPPPAPAAELIETATRLRSLNIRAHHLHYAAPSDAQVLARQTVDAALEGAGRAVMQLFTAEEGAFSANLMVPIVSTDVPYKPTPVAGRNAEIASALWGGIQAERRLVVVGETRRSSHLGFWIPLARGEHGAVLPGAPTAFLQSRGHAVFKDDPPPLTGFGEAMQLRWRQYMATEFRERLFLSLPYLYPDRGTLRPVAVLNVNVDTTDLSGWLRAHHKEWLRLARDRVQPFVEIAMAALVLILAAGRGIPRLDSGSDDWDTLPSVVPRWLPEGSK
jgi:hypothetical protein